MERRAGFCLAGTLLALGLASLPAISQDQNTHKDRYLYTNMDWTVPASPEQDRMLAVQTLNDRGFTKADIIAVLPLLEDLQTAEGNYDWTMHHSATILMLNPDSTSATSDAARDYRSAHDSIWNTITQKVGADKAAALRQLIEPAQQDVSTFTYRSARLDRINSLLADLDREEADRIAMIQRSQSGQNGTAAPTTASVETTFTRTTVTDVLPGFTCYTLPPLTTSQLVDILNVKLAHMEGDPEGIMMLSDEGRLTSPEIRFLREHKLWTWR
jgi:hypothetical protein